MLPAGTCQVSTGKQRGSVKGKDASVDLNEELVELVRFTGGWRNLDAQGGHRLGQIGRFEGRSRRRNRARGGADVCQDCFGLAFQGQKALHLLVGTWFLGAKFKQSGGSQHLGRPAGVLFPWKLKHQLVIADGLEGGFSHTEAIDAAIQHILDRFQLFTINLLNGSGGQHLQGELAAPPQVETEPQTIGVQNHCGADCQRQDEGDPTLLTSHGQRAPLVMFLAAVTIWWG